MYYSPLIRKKKSLIVEQEAYQLSFHVLICAFYPGISTFFGKSSSFYFFFGVIPTSVHPLFTWSICIRVWIQMVEMLSMTATKKKKKNFI